MLLLSKHNFLMESDIFTTNKFSALPINCQNLFHTFQQLAPKISNYKKVQMSVIFFSPLKSRHHLSDSVPNFTATL